MEKYQVKTLVCRNAWYNNKKNDFYSKWRKGKLVTFSRLRVLDIKFREHVTVGKADIYETLSRERHRIYQEVISYMVKDVLDKAV